jgi:ABC-type phosphonate transport system ATPase subunit
LLAQSLPLLKRPWAALPPTAPADGCGPGEPAENEPPWGYGMLLTRCSGKSWEEDRSVGDIKCDRRGEKGGEKKRLEIYQMLMLEPRFMILDETDSGLDIDALKVVAEGVNALRGAGRGMLVITHYQRLLDYIKPDRVHILSAGRIVKSGGPDLALELEKSGYDQFLKGG